MLLYYILSQFLTPTWKNCKGATVPSGGCASKTWSFSSACKNLVVQHTLGAEIWSSKKCAYGTSIITSFVVDRISQNFFCSTPKRLFSSMPFGFCHYLHRFQRYLHLNSTVVLNCTDFGTFFALPNFNGAVPPNVVFALIPQPNLEARQAPKFRRATPPNSEIISTPLLHFKPIFDPPLKKIVRGGRSRSRVRL